MNTLFLRDFRYGLDTRKSELTQRPGSLEVLHNGYVNQGGEIQNRKAFVRTARVAGTFGLQSTSDGLVTFGSGDLAGSHPVNVGTVGVPKEVGYQRLQHPSEVDGFTSGTYSMTGVVWSTSFGGLAFVLAQFSDGNVFAFYDGELVRDFTDGLRMAHLSTNALLAQDLARMVNARGINYTAEYTASNAYVDVVGPVSADFAASVTQTLEAGSSGTLTQAEQQAEVVGVTGVGAKSKFRVITGKDNAAASSSLTNDGTAPTNGSSVTINGTTYTWKTAIAVAGDVLIGNTVNGDAAMQNLVDAVNYTGVVGVAYLGSAPHATVKAGAYNTTTNVAVFTARTTGTVGNAYAVTVAGTSHGAWSANPMAGGLDTNKVSSVLAGTQELLSSAVIWEKDAVTTAANLVTQINSGSHGYTAEAIEEDVFITAPTANTQINGSDLVVTVVGQMCIGSLFAAFILAGSGFTFVQFNIDGVDVKGAIAGPLTVGAGKTYTTIEAFCTALADSITAYSGGTAYSAVAKGSVVYVSKYVTSSDDLPLNAFVTITPDVTTGTGSGVTLNNVPQVGAAQVILNTYLTTAAGFQGNNVYTDQIDGAVFFGTAPYAYEWVKVDGHPNIFTANVNQIYTRLHWNNTFAYFPGTYSARFKLIVRDNSGLVAESDPITAVFNITFN